MNTPIVYPISYIDQIVGSDGSGSLSEDSVVVSSTIADGTNDVEEITSGEEAGTVVTDAPEVTLPYYEGTDLTTPATVVTRQINERTDLIREFLGNGEEDEGDTLDDANYFGHSSKGEMYTGLRFPDMQVPHGANILSAQIIFTGAAPDRTTYHDGVLDMEIHGIKLGNPGSFTEGAPNYDLTQNYPETEATVVWRDVPAWEEGEQVNTVDISPLVQEIINQGSWSTGNAMGFRLNRRTMYPLDSTQMARKFHNHYPQDTAPILRIAYEDQTNGVPGAAATGGTSVLYGIQAADDDALEFVGNGMGDEDVAAGTVIYDNTNYFWLGGVYAPSTSRYPGDAIMGLCFTVITIPADAMVINSRLIFTTRSTGGVNVSAPLSLAIKVQDSGAALQTEANLPPFNGNDSCSERPNECDDNQSQTEDITVGKTTGNPKYDRVWSSDTVAWNNLPVLADNTEFASPNLAELVNPLVQRDTWEPTGSTLIFRIDKSNHDSGFAGRKVWEYSDPKKPKLLLDWVQPEPAGSRKMGLRFPSVEVPRNATVKNAYIRVTSGASASGDVTYTLQVEDSGDAAAYQGTDNEVSNRTYSATTVSWPVTEAWTDGEQYKTTDISPLVQAVVNRGDWCGKHMNFVISSSDTEAHRNILTGDAGYGAELVVEYDVNSVDYSNTCVEREWSGRVVSDDDDAEQFVDGSNVGDISPFAQIKQKFSKFS